MDIRRLFLFVCVLSIQGCAIGYNSVLFTTRSNVGLDLDTQPPTAEVSVSREELMIGPVFEGGACTISVGASCPGECRGACQIDDPKVLPVMASFSAKTETNPASRFLMGAGSTFATGEAAAAMAYLYGDPDYIDTKNGPLTQPRLPNATLALDTQPRDLPFGVQFQKPGQVRPVLFGTATSLGLRVNWSGLTAQYPSAVKIGFNRKELAWMPVTLNEVGSSLTSNRHWEVGVPSLLATVDTDVQGRGLDASLDYLQYFATGTAANNLARRQGVRRAMLARLDPESATETWTASSGATCNAVLDWLIAGDSDARLRRAEEWLAARDPATDCDLDRLVGDKRCEDVCEEFHNDLVQSGDLGGVDAGLTADFRIDPAAGVAPLTITLSDSSAGGPSGWTWHLRPSGDSSGEWDEYPGGAELVLRIDQAGTYDVALTVTKGGMSDRVERAAAVIVTALPVDGGSAIDESGGS